MNRLFEPVIFEHKDIVGIIDFDPNMISKVTITGINAAKQSSYTKDRAASS